MRICNRNYREVQRVEALSRQRIKSDNEIKETVIAQLQDQQDGFVRNIASYIGKLIGYLLFHSRK